MPCHLSKIQGLRWQGGSLERGCLAHREISWLSSLAQGASPHSHFRMKRGGPSLTHRPYPTANPTISITSVPRQRWVPNRGKQTAAPLSLKRGTRRECTVQADSPLKDIACVLLAQTKDAKIVCVSSGVK